MRTEGDAASGKLAAASRYGAVGGNAATFTENMTGGIFLSRKLATFHSQPIFKMEEGRLII